jgi:hypothetical protein
VQETVPPSKEAAIFEHLGACWVKLPEVPFARRTVLPWHFDEAIIETQVVTDRVLPCGPTLAVVGELLDDVIANLTERQHLIW